MNFPRLRVGIVSICVVASQLSATAAESIPSARLVGCSSLPATLAGIDAELNVKLRTGNRLRIVAPQELISWGRYVDVERGPLVVLSDGSTIVAEVLHFDAPNLTIGDASGLGRYLWNESVLPIDSVRGIIFQPPAAALDRDRIVRRFLMERKTEDQLLLVGGESVSGTIISAPRAGRFLPAEGAPPADVFELSRRGGTEPLTISAAKVVAVQFASSVIPQRGAPDPHLVLGLDDGSLAHIANVTVANDVVTLTLAAGGKLLTALPDLEEPSRTFWDSVTRVEARVGRVVFLSDLEPLGYKHIPFLGVQWPYGRDENVLGGRLRFGGSVATKGLGMHSASRLAYDLDGSFHRLEAELAIDEHSELAGSVVFKVLLESEVGAWTTAYESPVIRGGDKPVPLQLKLDRARRLALIVDFADRGDQLDHANWLNARLVK